MGKKCPHSWLWRNSLVFILHRLTPPGGESLLPAGKSKSGVIAAMIGNKNTTVKGSYSLIFGLISVTRIGVSEFARIYI